jgi:NitT/TauT family transport system substrate-binding protein
MLQQRHWRAGIARIIQMRRVGEPESLPRTVCVRSDAKRDVTLLKVANSTVPAAVRSGQAQIGVNTEPMITQGIRQRFWSEPFDNVPRELGPYAYSTLNVRLDSIQ